MSGGAPMPEDGLRSARIGPMRTPARGVWILPAGGSARWGDGVKTVGCVLFLLGLPATAAEWMAVGCDTKIELRRDGMVRVEPGRDTVGFFRVARGVDRPTFHHLPLANSAYGPPSNIAITPDQSLAVVANSVTWEESDGRWEAVVDSRLQLVDLRRGKPEAIGEVAAGRQPSGLSISRDGRLLLVANWADRTVSLFRIAERSLQPLDTVAVEGEPTAVAFHPDGRSALVTKFNEHRVGRITVEGGSLRHDPGQDIPVGLWPYNLKFLPDGATAIVANTGNRGQPDGHRDTLSVLDFRGAEPRVVDTVSVGDGPEGLAVSPDGRHVAVPLLHGAAEMFRGQWFHHEQGEVVLYAVDEGRLVERNRVSTGAFPAGVAFNADGSRLYVANLGGDSLSVFAVEGGRLSARGSPIPLPGRPASIGSGHP